MPGKRLSMRKIREVLRLRLSHKKSIREISQSCSIGKSTVSDYVLRASAAGLSWPLPDDISDEELERRLYSPPGVQERNRQVPDWSYVHKELKRKSVTLALLWHEYKEKNPDGYQYSWFCQQYAKWSGKIDLVMRQEHRAGEKLFVDYAGQTVEITSQTTGEMKQAQIFVSVLGASNYTYAEATWSQSLPDWIGSHVRALSYIDGVPEVLVPDNLKSGVNKACFYEPDLNPTYRDLAFHYDTVVLPARVRKAKDKAKVEVGVQVVERWILARLRNHTFFSLAELNGEISKLLVELNSKKFQKLPGTRKSMYETLDRPALKPLPSDIYQLAQWKKATVHIDYHVEIAGHYYSVPYQLVKRTIDVRFTENTVECFYKNKRISSHKRSYQKGQHTTVREHMPLQHQQYHDWSPQRFLNWASKIGPHTKQLTEIILASRNYPQQAYRTLLGILRLGKSYTDQRLEAACGRAVAIGAKSFRSVESILKNGLDQREIHEEKPSPPVKHDNIRGSKYYQNNSI